MTKTTQDHELVMNYLPLAQSISKKYTTLDYDDANQEACVSLMIAEQKFDEERGSFGCYARRIIMNNLNKMYNYEKKIIVNSSSNDDDKEDDDVIDEYESKFTCNDRYQKLMIYVRDILNKDEQLLVDLKLSGMNQNECAAILGVSQTVVSRKLKTMRIKIKNILEI